MSINPTIRINTRLVNLHTSYNKHTPTRMLSERIGQCHCGLLLWVGTRTEVAWSALLELTGKEAIDNLADINMYMAYLKANLHLVYSLEPGKKDHNWYVRTAQEIHDSLLARAHEHQHAQK